jgi:gliding motility-associated-like protein
VDLLGTGTFTPNNAELATTYVLSKSDSAAGQVKIMLVSTNNGNCQAGRDTVTIALEPNPTLDAGKDKNICIGAKSIVLNGTSNTASVLWQSKGTGFFFPTATTTNAEYFFSKADSANGKVTLVLNSSQSVCSVSDSLSISFGGKNFVDAGKDFFTCTATDGLQLAGIVAGTTEKGKWSRLEGNGIFLPSDTTLNGVYAFTPTDSARGFVRLLLTSTNDGICLPGKDTIKISFKNFPKLEVGNDRALCKGATTVNLKPTITNLSGIRWKTLGSGTFIPTDTTTNIDYVIGRADSLNGEVLLVAISNDKEACQVVSDTLKVIVKNPIAPGFVFSNPCAKQKVAFLDTTKVLVGNVKSRIWNFGDNSSSAMPNPVHIFERDQTYQVTLIVESNLGCKDSSTKAVTLRESPVADFTTDEAELVINKEITFADLSKNAVKWAWNFGDGTDTLKIQNVKHIYGIEATYNVSLAVTNTFMCTDTVTKKLVIKAGIVLPPKLPNAFSPSDDPSKSNGANDIFYPRGGPFAKAAYEFKVYNIWGELVFESDDPEKGWDGYYKNKLQPVGSYIYTLKAKTTDGKEYVRTGDVSIIR